MHSQTILSQKVTPFGGLQLCQLAQAQNEWGFPDGTSGKEPSCQCKRCAFIFWGGEDPLEQQVAAHSSILAGESHGQRSLAGYSPWGCKELDTAE